MNILFMGTADFSATVLKKLNTKHKITAVVTGVDKPSNRGKVIFSAVKQTALELNIPLLQFNKVSAEGIEQINKLNPDIVVTAAFGQILSDEFLKIPKFGTLNVHASLLPKYRGASPIQQSVLNGDRETGVTAMQMDVGLDTGDILKVVKTEIGVNETSGELFDRLSLMGGELILDTLSALEKGEITPIKQDESLATHTSKIDKSLCPIDFTKPAFEVHNKIRGLNPWPVATTEINGKKIKVHSSLLCEKSGKAGTVISTKPLIVACGEKSVELCEIQPEGKKKMTAEAFLAGHRLSVGDVIG